MRTDLAGHHKDGKHQENENKKVDDEDVEHEILEQIQFVSPGSQMLVAMFDHMVDQKRDSFFRFVWLIFQDGRPSFHVLREAMIGEDLVDVVHQALRGEVRDLHPDTISFGGHHGGVVWLIQGRWGIR